MELHVMQHYAITQHICNVMKLDDVMDLHFMSSRSKYKQSGSNFWQLVAPKLFSFTINFDQRYLPTFYINHIKQL